MTVVSEGCATVIAAQHMLAFRRLRLLCILAVADLTEQGLVLKLGLNLALFFAHGSLV